MKVAKRQGDNKVKREKSWMTISENDAAGETGRFRERGVQVEEFGGIIHILKGITALHSTTIPKYKQNWKQKEVVTGQKMIGDWGYKLDPCSWFSPGSQSLP